MNTLPVIIIGAGGHAKVLIDILKMNDAKVIGMTDENIINSNFDIMNVPIIGNDNVILDYSTQEISLVNGVGSIGSTKRRQHLFEKFKDGGYSFHNTVHVSAILAKDISYGEGIQIMAGAVIQPGCKLGSNIIINTRASIDHDCIIHDHVHIAPGVTISGGVVIGEGAHIGTGAVVIQGIKIGKNGIVGAGAVVIKDVADNQLVVGIPAKAVEK
ncbi:UDP-perosamine 4-acetyltransferase [Pelosinus fermentans]|uniref:acetyltransferase n=1 Tax=Pelosinus fermentans TaxID=365349 RepID=UPI0002685C25|nr:acetyltransferase [Pelosinus fermentans]OAM92779.1 sugar O-acyltransferase, sialic acid O-acetyltransferase NeuD family [Pelosinus fermentans DSM 17108]SDQ56585.1 UDP-perosamine 4-acetyltransferase [Pelosinus fermentans]